MFVSFFLGDMVRKYKQKEFARSYFSYTQQQLDDALKAVRNGMKLRDARDKFKVPVGTLSNKLKNKHTLKPGHPTVFSSEEELSLCNHLKVVSDWGFPFGYFEAQILVQSYLKLQNREITCFKNNIPSTEWVRAFLARHKEHLTFRMCQNIKTARAEKHVDEIADFFEHYKQSVGVDSSGMSKVPATHIFNYDETNLADDPGAKKCIFKRGVKYPDRVMNSSKSSTSIMFCGSASGAMLPCYVVYKSECLWNTWMEGGPPNTRYNRTKSGWFDSVCFEDWFEACFIKHTKHLTGRKVLIGDNLSSHFSKRVVELAEEHDVTFLCLPSNATHLLQPLDVAFFRPLKIQWRKLLEAWKACNRSKSVTKNAFPRLLTELFEKLYPSAQETSQNMVSGFRATGLFPINPKIVINKLPRSPSGMTEVALCTGTSLVSDAVVDLLRTMRGTDEPPKKKRRTRVNVIPGKSISSEDLSGIEASSLTAISQTPQAALSSSRPSSKTRRGKKSKTQKTEESEDFDCLFCGESYVHPPNETWIKCDNCERWCHEACADLRASSDFYICDLCAS